MRAYDAEGIVAEAFTERVRRTIKGTSIVHNAGTDIPAYLVTVCRVSMDLHLPPK